MIGHLATVVSQVNDPETGAYGVNVVYRDGTATFYDAKALGVFVRVLQQRAHPHHGSNLGLPRPGELGVVAELHGGFQVWMGSLHWQDANQVAPDPGLEAHRHDSGVSHRIHADGRSEWSHPSGLRLTVSPDGAALPDLERKGSGIAPPDEARTTPAIELEHPSGLKVHIGTDGSVSVTKAKTLTAQVDESATVDVGGDLTATAGGDVRLKASKFILDGPVECTQTLKVAQGIEGATVKAGPIDLAAHKHTCAAPGSPSSSSIP